MTPDQIKQIQDKVARIERAASYDCRECEGRGKTESEWCPNCGATGKSWDDENLEEAVSICRSLLEERQRGLILSVQVKEIRNAGFREGIEAAIVALRNVRGASDTIGRVLQEIRALLPSTQTKEEG